MPQYRGEKVRYRRRGLLRLRLRQLLEAGYVRLWPGQVHRLEPEHHLPAHAAEWALQPDSSRYDRAPVWRAAGDSERAVRVQEAPGNVMPPPLRPRNV